MRNDVLNEIDDLLEQAQDSPSSRCSEARYQRHGASRLWFPAGNLGSWTAEAEPARRGIRGSASLSSSAPSCSLITFKTLHLEKDRRPVLAHPDDGTHHGLGVSAVF